MLQLGGLKIRRVYAVALAFAVLVAASLFAAQRAHAANPADAGVCTMQLTESWAPAVTSSVALNSQWNLGFPGTTCTAVLPETFNIVTAFGAADAVSCAVLGDVEGQFQFSTSDGTYQSGQVLSVAAAGPFAAQEWAFVPDAADFYDSVATFTLTNPQQELAQCQAGGISSVAITARFVFASQNVVAEPIGIP